MGSPVPKPPPGVYRVPCQGCDGRGGSCAGCRGDGWIERPTQPEIREETEDLWPLLWKIVAAIAAAVGVISSLVE